MGAAAGSAVLALSAKPMKALHAHVGETMDNIGTVDCSDCKTAVCDGMLPWLAKLTLES
jgi:hypothetical protein